MKKLLTKLTTILLTFMLVVGMSANTATTAYAASKGGSSLSYLLSSLKKAPNNKKDKKDKNNKNNKNNKKENKAPTSNSAVLDNDKPENPNDSLNLSKSISKNEDGSYTINLEAYATGKVDVTHLEKDKPTDIVLVLDESSSMLETLGTTTEVTYEKYTKTTNGDLYNQRDYLYVKVGDKYYKVTVNANWGTYTYSYNDGKNTITYRGYKYNGRGPNWDFYKRKTVTKEEALENAVTNFVNNVQQQAKANNVNHRIAIVVYGGDDDYDYKNTEILTTQNVINYEDATKENYKNALVSVNVNGSLNTRVSNAIDRIDVEDGTPTAADLGMEMANKVLINNPSTDRNKVVVMFTDGEPNHGRGFDDDVADDAIEKSKSIKNTQKAKVYTVGLLKNANPNDTKSDINKYMNYVSSNYPNATDLDHPGAGGSNKGYYMNADNASQLNNIFEKISEDIETPSTSVTLNGESQLKDIITDNFTLPAGISKDDIKVFTEDFNGKDSKGNYTWKNRQPLANAKIEIEDPAISVSGFDYSQNYAVTISGQNRGKKLIVQVPVNIVRTFGGNNIPSNENTSAIYDKGEMVKPFEEPVVDQAIDYKLAGTEQWINEGENVTLSSLIGFTSDGDFSYEPDGRNNRFVDLEYTIKNEDGSIAGSFTVKAGETLQANTTEIGPLNKDTQYTIECKVTPITDGSTKETIITSGIDGHSKQEVEQVKSYVYIRGIEKAFIIDFDKPVTYNKEQVFTENQLSSSDKINQIKLSEGTNTYGDLTLNNNKSITYKLNKFMEGIDTYKFDVANKCTQTVKMIPATSVYYDDNFVSDTDGEGIVYSDNWELKTSNEVNKELQDAAQGLDANYGYDHSYDDFIGNSNGTVHQVTAPDSRNTTASVTFTGTGIDLYALTNQTGGKVYSKLYNSKGEVVKSLIREYSYKTGQLFHVPVISYNNLPKDKYTLKVTILKGSTFYLDGVRIYNPLGSDIDELPEDAKDAYEADGELGSQIATIRDGILGNSSIINKVEGTVYIDTYNSSRVEGGVVQGHNVVLGSQEVLDEYTAFGCKTETYLPAGKSITLTLDKDYSNLQLGLKTSEKGATYKINGGDNNKLNSSTDMYYKVTAKDNKITITNTSKVMIEITSLKVVE